MGKLVIDGGNKISGEIGVQGAKNAVLPILAATVMADGVCTLKNCPYLRDVDKTDLVLERLGCRVHRAGNTVTVDTRGMCDCKICEDLMREMRSSIIFLGAIISRCKKAVVSMPGGCPIGLRPIDLHLKAFRKLGVQIEESQGVIHCRIKSKLKPCSVSLLCPSVGATENIMLLMAKSDGETVIRNAAREPEIVDLQDFLNLMGADIKGAGSDVIVINGVKKLHGADFEIMPDRIVAVTYMAAVAGCGGEILLKGINLEHSSMCNSILKDIGADIRKTGDGAIISMSGRPRAVNTIKTLYYPGFPTDAQPPFMAVMTVADGTTVFLESIFENRFRHASELAKLGADIDVNMCQATVRGREFLSGADVRSYDLRGAAAMVIGGLMAEGTTRVGGLPHIERGYQDIVSDLESLGADIRIVY